MSGGYRSDYSADYLNCPVEIINGMETALDKLRQRSWLLGQLAGNFEKMAERLPDATDEDAEEYRHRQAKYEAEAARLFAVYKSERAKLNGALIVGYSKSGDPAMRMEASIDAALAIASNGVFNHPIVFDLSRHAETDEKLLRQVEGQRVLAIGTIQTQEGKRKGIYIGPENDSRAAIEYLIDAKIDMHEFKPTRVYNRVEGEEVGFSELLEF